MGLPEITIFNTDGLAKFGETICHCFGLTARGNKKVADAESYAAIKKARTETEVAILKLQGEEDVANYVLARETRKMDNAVSVVTKATKHFMDGEKVPDEPVNQDWTNKLFSIIEDVSDETLQEMWAKVLSGEVKQPKSYSLRTLDLLKNISKDEALLFSNTSRFYIANNYICSDVSVLSLQDALTLSDAGLLISEALTKDWEVPANDKLLILFDKEYFWWIYNNTNNIIKLDLNVKKLTKAGAEILSLISYQEKSVFVNYVVERFKKQGVSGIMKHRKVKLNNGNEIFDTIGVEL